MDKKIIILAGTITVFAAAAVYNLWSIVSVKQTVVENSLPREARNAITSQIAPEQKDSSTSTPVSDFGPPLDRAGERITKKNFGQYITPQNSPVKPEKFRGFHTGTDFEIFPEEINADIPVRAICAGKIALKKTATGYGGLLVQDCEIDDQKIAAIYGHLKLASITKKAGDAISKGDEIGILGKANSPETSGERKHLHLGVRKGSAIDIRGYVQNQSELSEWIDPCGIEEICK